MKIHTITAQNYIGARDISLRLKKPILLAAGANYAGKSSIREAVKHALTGECSRITLKKDYADLVSDGEKSGHVIVDTNLGKAAITLPNGKHEIAFEAPAALPYVIDAQRFAHLDAHEKRAFLFGLMGLSASGESVRAALIERNCKPEFFEAVMPLLRAGFDAAHTEAKNRARDAKAAWKAVTNEVYGSQKAITWRATKPTFDETKLKHAQAAIAELDRSISEHQAQLGGIVARLADAGQRTAKIASLRQRASQYARWQDKLLVDEPQLAKWEQKVVETRALAEGEPFIKHLSCPECGCLVELNADGDLAHYRAPKRVADRDAADRLPEYIKARDLLKKSVENDRKALEDADQAAKAIKEIEDDKSEPPGPDEAESLRNLIVTATTQRDNARADVAALTNLQRDVQTADKRSSDAAAYHAEVQEWEVIADALSPDGIPGKMLADALRPINARIEESSIYVEWLPITIGSDMSITSNGRQYRMLSESEQWRADALIAEAISHLSGLKILVLDRVDVLDQKGRADLVAWLDQWANDGDIDTALLFATLKERPVIRFENVEVFWIENGSISEQKKAA